MKNEECEHFWITSKYSKKLICEKCGKLHPENELLYENNNLKQELSELKGRLKSIEWGYFDGVWLVDPAYLSEFLRTKHIAA